MSKAAPLKAAVDDKATNEDPSSSSPSKDIRIFMDGAFDLMHFGHMNAFRLAKSLGTYLVVGVNSDQSITECKGAPLMNDQERLAMVESCKFVDKVVADCPYIMNQEYLDWVIKEYNIDYVVHGDDPCIVNGKDVYATAKSCGKFRTIPRTEGISTTDIVGRILLLDRDDVCNNHFLGRRSRFLTTTRLLQLFSANNRSPYKTTRVVYIDGAWDLLHPGHVAMLNAASKRGDYLIVGVHGDAVVNQHRGRELPLLNLHERVLSVLGCRYVDEVLIDAPYQVTTEMIASLNIAEVIGWEDEDAGSVSQLEEDRLAQAERASILTALTNPSDFRLGNIVERIHKNHVSYQAKLERKINAETQLYREKYKTSSIYQ